jgi:hypothetical protein
LVWQRTSTSLHSPSMGQESSFIWHSSSILYNKTRFPRKSFFRRGTNTRTRRVSHQTWFESEKKQMKEFRRKSFTLLPYKNMNHNFTAAVSINPATGYPFSVCSHCGEYKGTPEGEQDCKKAPIPAGKYSFNN